MSDLNELVKYYEEFSGKDEVEAVKVMMSKIQNAEFEMVTVLGNKGTKTTYAWKEDWRNDMVFAYVEKPNGVSMPVILPRNLSIIELGVGTNQFNVKKSKSLVLKTHGRLNDKIAPAISKNHTIITIHKLIMENKGEDLKGKQIDHMYIHEGLAIPEWLRPCTNSENSRNKPNYRGSIQDEFTYDPLRDYSHSFYIPFLYYVLGEIDEEDMRTLREMELKAELAA